MRGTARCRGTAELTIGSVLNLDSDVTQVYRVGSLAYMSPEQFMGQPDTPENRAKFIATIPLGRGGTPEEAAGAVYMFCIPESNYVSGQVLVCGGGRP